MTGEQKKEKSSVIYQEQHGHHSDQNGVLLSKICEEWLIKLDYQELYCLKRQAKEFGDNWKSVT